MKKLTALLSIPLLMLCACKEESPKNDAPVQKPAVEAATVQEIQQEVEQDANLISALKAKVKNVIGNAEVLRNSDESKRKQLRIGQKVVENDRVQTQVESEVGLVVPDGSLLQIAENSDVVLKVEKDKDGKEVFVTDITKGNVYFDIQKQKDKSFQFKTGTATAAIRGTAGFVGFVGGKTVASLKEGKVEVISKSGKSKMIVQKQTVIVDEKGEAKMLSLQSSGTVDLAQAIDSIAASGDTVAADLEKQVKEFDKSYEEKLKSFEKSLSFKASRIADSVLVPSVTLQARVTPGTIVKVWGERDSIGANGIYQKTFEWADNAYGTKRFLASCSNGEVEIPCFMWVTEYADPAKVDQASSMVVPSEEAPAKTQENKEEKKKAEENKEDKKDKKQEAEEEAVKPLKVSVKIGGPRTEKVHLDLPKTSLKTSLKVKLAGISESDLKNIKSITVTRGGSAIKTLSGGDVSMSFDVPVEIARNKIADFEVIVTDKKGKKFNAKKTYEVYCLVRNHPGGKARNFAVPQDQEYEQLVQNGLLTRE